MRRWFRPTARGIDRLPIGPCVIVANHGIAAPWEWLTILALVRQHRPEIRVRAMTHRLWERWGPLWRWLGRLGCIAATEDAAHDALAAGDAVLVFPGGTREETRPFWRWDEADLCGRLGWARIASQSKVPVVPLALLGSQRVNPPLLQWSGFSYMSGVRLFGVRDMPLTLAQVLASIAVFVALSRWTSGWIALLIAWVVLWSPLLVFLPLMPVRIQLAFGEPVEAKGGSSEELRNLYALVSGELDAMLVRLRADRART